MGQLESAGDRRQGQVAAIVVAAGKGSRMAKGERKQFRLLAGKPVYRWSVDKFGENPLIDEIVVVTAAEHVDKVKASLSDQSKVTAVVPGGETRRESVARGLAALSGSVAWVLVHDGVRPLLTHALIESVLAAAKAAGAAAPGVPVTDTIKRIGPGGEVLATVDRSELCAVQTPQGFRRDLLEEAHAKVAGDATDDCGMVEALGATVQIVPGDPHNVKITTERDWEAISAMLESREEVAAGFGLDVHRLVEGRPLILGGVRFEYPFGLAGHSDADVLCHAVIDAMFGAAGMDDIGTHFPDTDARFQGADSLELLRTAAEKVKAAGNRVVHVDVFVSAEAPKLRPRIFEIKGNLARALGIDPGRVNVKAGTGEGVGPVGRREVIEARAVVTLARPRRP